MVLRYLVKSAAVKVWLRFLPQLDLTTLQMGMPIHLIPRPAVSAPAEAALPAPVAANYIYKLK